MRAVAIVVCLAYASHGRRLQMPVEREHGSSNARHQSSKSRPLISNRQIPSSSPLKSFATRLLSLQHAAAGYHAVGPAPARTTGQMLPVRRALSVLATEGGSQDAEAEAERKRLKAQRLALEAERAKLQAEELELKIAQLKLQAAKNRPEEEEEVAPAPAMASSATNEGASAAPTPSPLPVAPPAPAPLFGANTSELPLAGQLSDFAKAFGFTDAGATQLTPMQIEAVKANVFDLGSFYLREVEQTFIGTMFKGNLRANSSVAFESVNSKLKKVPELRDFKLMLMEDPLPVKPGEEPPLEREPVFVAIPIKNTERDFVLPEYFLTGAGFLTSIFSTLAFSLTPYLLANGPEFTKMGESGDTSLLGVAVPVAFGIAVIQFIHEAAHIGAASKYGLKVGFPTVLPSLQLGTFGCITKLLAFPTNRTALFDFALSGPAVAGVLSLIVYIVGLLFSVNLPPAPISTNEQAADTIAKIANAFSQATPSAGPIVDASTVLPDNLNPVTGTRLLRSSYLLGALANLIVPAVSTNEFVSLHPLAVIGFVSFLLNALNLMPIGRLDGGRMSQAVIGNQAANGLSSFVLIALGVSSIFSTGNDAIFWFGFTTILFSRLPESPCIDDITEVDDNRKTLAGVIGLIVLLTLVPMPQLMPLPPGAGSPGGFPPI